MLPRGMVRLDKPPYSQACLIVASVRVHYRGRFTEEDASAFPSHLVVIKYPHLINPTFLLKFTVNIIGVQ